MSTNHGQYAQTFHQLDHFGNSDFQQLFKAPPWISLTEIIRIASYFLRYIDPDIYEDLTKPISMDELERTLQVQLDTLVRLGVSFVNKTRN